jgi:hypothetical protein
MLVFDQERSLGRNRAGCNITNEAFQFANGVAGGKAAGGAAMVRLSTNAVHGKPYKLHQCSHAFLYLREQFIACALALLHVMLCQKDASGAAAVRF